MLIFKSLAFFLLTLLNLNLTFAEERPNILFVAIDDLRPELGCYGSPIAVTPTMDSLAAGGLMFNRAYCQQAICRPSRASLMTGLRPETTGLFHNYVSLRELQPEILTLPQHFIANGYQAAYSGKVFHHGDTDEAFSWNVKATKTNLKKPLAYALPENIKLRKENRKRMTKKYGEAARYGLGSGPAYEQADVADEVYVDGYNTQTAIATLKEMVKDDRPFFLAMGYKLPHLNWVAPKKYWDLYQRDQIPLAQQTTAPEGGAAMGLHASFELRTRAGIPKTGPINDELARTLKHAYLASVSYVDAQLGLLIDALNQTGLRDNTIIVIWSDHGWHLGDMGVWGKATNYEIGTRVPLIVWTPDMKLQRHQSDALVELIDIFPTLCELTGVESPKHLEGRSFAPLLKDPGQPWKSEVFSQYPNPALREWAANPLSVGMRETFFGPLLKEVEQKIVDQMGDKWDRELFENDVMGYAIRTDRYRLVQWQNHKKKESEPIFVELYDLNTDPSETFNIAQEQPELASALSARLESQMFREKSQHNHNN